MTPNYRPDIDGLRAIAVLAVLLFHLGFAGFGGGYVGVDVFFVISGYLITIIIVREIDAGTFTVSSFYERRFRRILPAAITVALACLALGAFLLPSSDYVELAKSAVANGVFASNFYFYLVTGYFDGPAELKPLLHTWSLAVEEQFYVLFPLLLLAIARYSGRQYLAWLLPIAAASLAASAIVTPVDPAAAFFLLPTRAWELAAGALLVIVPARKSASPVVNNLVAGSGLVLIAAAVVLFDDTTPFPGIHALVPVMGAAMIIQAGKDDDFLVKRLLSIRPLVFIGLISYSLYLWHWPIYVFAKRFHLGELEFPVQLILLALSLAIATLSWRFVEMPFRRQQRFRGVPRVFSAAFTASALVIGVAVAIVVQHGGTFAIAPERQQAGVVKIDPEWSRWKACETKTRQSLPSMYLAACRLGEANASASFGVWGDSHAMALASAVHKSAGEASQGGWLAARSACLPLVGIARFGLKKCREFNAAILREIKENPDLETVILAARWNLASTGTRYKEEEGGPVELVDFEEPEKDETNADLLETGLRRTIDVLQQMGKQVVIVGPVPEIGHDVPAALDVAERTGRDLSDLNDLVAPTVREFESRSRETLQIINSVEQDYRIQTVMPAAYLCDDVVCRVVGETGKPYYRDDDHLSTYGAREISQAFDTVFRHVRSE